MTTDLRAALAPKAEGAQTIEQWISARAAQIDQILPRAIGVERFTRICLTEIGKNPELRACTPASVAGCLMLCAQLGLEPGPLGWAYLVPYKQECTFILGYKGIIELARRSGQMRDIETGIVHEGDAFDYRKGSRRFLDHKPNLDRDAKDKILAYYAVVRLIRGGVEFEILTPSDVEAARMRSPMGRVGKGAWHTDYAQMARKTCVRRLSPYLPASVELARALHADEQAVSLDVTAGPTWPELIEPEPEAAPPAKHTEGAGQSK